MASSGSVFSQTLQEITTTKLEELSKRYASYEKSKSTLLAALEAAKTPIDRLELLSKGVKQCLSLAVDKHGEIVGGQTKHPGLEKKLKNLDRFFAQARYDPSVSNDMMKAWEASLIEHLDTQSLKFQYASLYGQLVSEWLSTEQSAQRRAPGTGDSGAADSAARKEKLEMRKAWEAVVFSESGVNPDQVSGYLDGTFGQDRPNREQVLRALKTLRDRVAAFENTMNRPNQFTQDTLTWTINGLLTSGILSPDQRDVLRDFKANPIILAEVADVLNMRLAALDSWSWGDMVGVEQDRLISGIYNIRMHEDILQAIFLQFIGVQWSVLFKDLFRVFRKTKGAWKFKGKDVPLAKRRRLQQQLGGALHSSNSLQARRHGIYTGGYFVSNLLTRHDQQRAGTEGEHEVEYGRRPAPSQAPLPKNQQMQQQMTQQMQQQMNQQRAQQMAQQRHFQQKSQMRPAAQMAASDPSSFGSSNSFGMSAGFSPKYGMPSDLDEESDGDWESDHGPEDMKPFALKQEILHLLATEIALNTKLHGEITAFHCVFERWNSLLPHETILSFLRFWGVSPSWLGFFSKFLKAPLKWMDAEEGTPVRERRRGAPASHVLTELFGEAVLFGLDFAVNQATSGNVLWRVQDDLWFWSPEHNNAIEAWKVVEEFVAVIGVPIDGTKTGSVRISDNPDVALPLGESLPEGDIRWGFLALSPETGRFDIDQSLVDTHIEDLLKQLQEKEKSVFSFVQTWNSYASTFFSSNFGIPANCFGRGHVDKMLETHHRIQKRIFSALTEGSDQPSASIADYLKKILRDRFGAKDVPDGFLYFPAELGGLDLKSPFITLLQIRDDVLESTDETFAALAKSERDAYQNALQAFISGKTSKKRAFGGQMAIAPPETEAFLSFEDYVLYREEFDFRHPFQVKDAFNQLMKKPTEQSIDLSQSPEIQAAVAQIMQTSTSPSVAAKLLKLKEPYWKWVMIMYGQEIFGRFGGLNIVEPGLLPMGMVSIFKESKVQWSA
ncbi:hypothetical protein jhhlp_008472 [Lomentospora prolificans]|uniref:Reverse transcriptase domain-containing protein n=1 Tax=Lomentospora prolificans TaxID=41688 RepID=A0A2N3MY53_9PEZI|nr:hypothetical protein jhhlp_008472 [Lomentospora prolificans]